VHLETTAENDIVLVEFDDRMDRESLLECAQRFDRIPRIWWKHVMVVLRRIDALDSEALGLLRYLEERASGCNLQLVECRPEVAGTLQAAALLR
jgi:hypothetical protein